MRIVILGAGGQLAYDLQREIAEWDLILFSHDELDICDYPRVRQKLAEIQPRFVINTAAFVQVDACENEVKKAFSVNAFAVRYMAQVCSDIDCSLVHMSTDYVFGGAKQSPYTEEDLPNPLNVYGASKLVGEYFVRNLCPKHFIFRTSGLYGVVGSSGKGGNFVETMIRLARKGKPIRVVNDQVLTPTYTRDLAKAIKGLMCTDSYGLYHLTNGGSCSWHRFAAAIFKLAQMNPDLRSISTDAYEAAAERPSYSVLTSHRLKGVGINPLRPWQDALKAYLHEKDYISG